MSVVFITFLVIILVVALSCIKIVNQSRAYVVERMGVYNRTLEAGINFLVPFMETVVKRVDLREQVLDFQPQPVITKDNVTMMIDSVVYM